MINACNSSPQCQMRHSWWCGVAWCGVVWRGVVWCGVVWRGVAWCGVVWRGVVWCGVWCGVVGCGVVWCSVVWCGAAWCDVVCLYSNMPHQSDSTMINSRSPHVKTYWDATLKLSNVLTIFFHFYSFLVFHISFVFYYFY